MTVALLRASIYEDDVERSQLIADTTQFSFHIIRGGGVAVLQVAQIELHARTKTSVQGNLVDGLRWPHAASQHRILGGMEVPGRVHTGAVVGG